LHSDASFTALVILTLCGEDKWRTVYQEEKIEREQRWEKIKDTSVEAIPKLRLRLPPGALSLSAILDFSVDPQINLDWEWWGKPHPTRVSY